MAQFTYTDFKIHDKWFHMGATETLRQNVDIFNGASNGSFVMQDNRLPGDFNYETYFSLVNDLIQERDPSATGVVADTELTQKESISVKLNRRLGPLKGTIDEWKKIGKDPEEFSYIIGQQSGVAMAQDYLESMVSATAGALANTAAVYHDGTAATINHQALITALAKRGDRANEISTLVMHSKTYYDLVGQQVTDNVLDVAGAALHTATPVTLGRNVIVTDSEALKNGANFYTLMLAPGAGKVEESEGRSMVMDDITGFENLMKRIQGEHAYNVGLRGFQWDVAVGGKSPNKAAVALGTNWTQIATDVKDLGGVALETQ